MFLFPFGDVKVNSRIAIWGGGVVGQSYVGQILSSRYADIECIIDRKEISIAGIRYQKPRGEDLSMLNVDYIIIAISDEKVAEGVRNEIIKSGIKSDIVYNIINYYGPAGNLHIREIVSYSVNNHNNPNSVFLDSSRIKILRRIHSSLIVKKTKDKMVRVGGNADGGYLMCQKFDNAKIAYSFGVGDNTSWDKSIADKGIDVFMYDHTVADVDLSGYEDRLHFFRIGLTAIDCEDLDNMDTLEGLINRNGHNQCKSMILKMDIEGAEWDVLGEISKSTLEMFDYFVVEFHGLTNEKRWDEYATVLEKISGVFQAIHIHGNNACGYIVVDGKRFPDTVEVSYINRTGNVFTDSSIILPNEYDRRNVEYLDEIVLDNWNGFFEGIKNEERQ